MESDSSTHVKPIDLFCIDYGPMEDLMFWDRFARFLREDHEDEGRDAGRILLVGSGEKTEGMLGGRSIVNRRRGALQFSDDRTSTYERGMREELQTITAGLTDQGISTVGYTGIDRKMLIVDNNSRGAVNAGGRAVQSVTKWTSHGVISVLSCAANGLSGDAVDVHPLEAALTLRDSMTAEDMSADDIHVLIVAQRVTDTLKAASSSTEPPSMALEDAEGIVAEYAFVADLVRRGERIRLTHPDLPNGADRVELVSTV